MVKKYMGIFAKREMFLRFMGASIFLLGLVISIYFDIYSIKTLQSSIILFLIDMILFSFIICAKLEVNFVSKNYLIIILLVSGFFLILLTLGLIYSLDKFIFFLLVSSNILIIISWHYSLSLYKMKKVFFLIGSIIYLLISIFFRIKTSMDQFGVISSLVPLLFIIIGLALIIVIELRMIKKGLLKYI